MMLSQGVRRDAVHKRCSDFAARKGYHTSGYLSSVQFLSAVQLAAREQRPLGYTAPAIHFSNTPRRTSTPRRVSNRTRCTPIASIPCQYVVTRSERPPVGEPTHPLAADRPYPGVDRHRLRQRKVHRCGRVERVGCERNDLETAGCRRRIDAGCHRRDPSVDGDIQDRCKSVFLLGRAYPPTRPKIVTRERRCELDPSRT
jgi:hypothetical protein